MQPRSCPACGHLLTYRQTWKGTQCCSRVCARSRVVSRAPKLEATLAILRANRDWFLTVADISIWLYGDDSRADRDAAHTHLYRLRRLGYGVESRAATWEFAQGGARGYRLISEPSSRAKEAA